MPTKSTTFRSNTFSLLALALISVTLHPGCNEDKIRSLDTQLSEANKRVEAFKKDAIDARNGIDDAKEKARVAQQAAEDLRKQLASKQEDIDNLFGLKELVLTSNVMPRETLFLSAYFQSRLPKNSSHC